MDNLFTAIRSTIGEMKTRQFLQVLNSECGRRGRLLYWQEQALTKIAEFHPEYVSLRLEEVLQRLSICHVHGFQLEAGRMEIETGTDHRSPAFYDRAAVRFPYACMVSYVREGEKIRHADHDVLYCRECREALIEWNRGRRRSCGLPADLIIPPRKSDQCSTTALEEINNSEIAKLHAIVDTHPRLCGYYIFGIVSILQLRIEALSQEMILEKLINHFDDDPTLPDPDFIPDHEWSDYETTCEQAHTHAIESLVGGGRIGHSQQTMSASNAEEVFARLVAECGSNPRFYMGLGLGERDYVFNHGILIVADDRAGMLGIVESD